MADILDVLPKKGEYFLHTKTGNLYHIEGSTFNTITDQIDIKYTPMYECEYGEFTRQLKGHPKAFMTPNDDGTPRFTRVSKKDLGLE